jgi:hypothetical protein
VSEDEIGETCFTQGRSWKLIQNFNFRKRKEKIDCSRWVGFYIKILKWGLKKWDFRVRTGCKWLRMGFSNCCFELLNSVKGGNLLNTLMATSFSKYLCPLDLGLQIIIFLFYLLEGPVADATDAPQP